MHRLIQKEFYGGLHFCVMDQEYSFWTNFIQKGKIVWSRKLLPRLNKCKQTFYLISVHFFLVGHPLKRIDWIATYVSNLNYNLLILIIHLVTNLQNIYVLIGQENYIIGHVLLVLFLYSLTRESYNILFLWCKTTEIIQY